MLAGFMDTLFCRMNKTTTADGYGGSIVSYADGTRFMAGLANVSSNERPTADRDMTQVQQTLVTPVTVLLSAGDRVKRLSDGALFEVISYGAEKKTPACASTMMRHAEVMVRRITA